MKIFACFPSKYLKAADLCDKHVQAVISHVALEELQNKDGADMCPILYFNSVPKGMVLNKTNAKAISNLYSDETEAWEGMPIVLFPAMVAFGAETVEAIRVKAPSAASRMRAMKEHPYEEMLTERMHEDRTNYEGHAKPAAALTPENIERAKEIFRKKNTKDTLTPPTPRPKPIEDVIWDETAERALTAEERAEQLREQLRESLARSNAALEERRAGRGAANPDGLDIPGFLQRAKPKEPEYNQNSWIELMQAAE